MDRIMKKCRLKKTVTCIALTVTLLVGGLNFVFYQWNSVLPFDSARTSISSNHSDVPVDYTSNNTSELSARKEEFINHRVVETRKNIFNSRWNHIVKTCTAEGRPPPTDIEHSKLSSNMILEFPHNILYCPVEKVASTFWRKTLTAMNSMGFYSSPYDVKGPKFGVKSYIYHMQHDTNLNIESFKKHAASLLVVRDPYAKIFSAYVDKLFHPNVLFWNYIGKPIDKIIVNKTTLDKSLICGNKVKFSDYVKFLIHKFKTKQSLNAHFTSITSHCDPCVTKYDYVSKLETFKEDVKAILGNWNKTFNLNIRFHDFERDSALEIARVHIHLVLITKKKTENSCSIPTHMYLFRTWRFLQISGIIPKEAEFPKYWNEQSYQLKPKHLLPEISKVLPSTLSLPKVKKQRKEAMLQAYATVTKDDLYALREIVKDDCRYFGYNDMPKDIFNQSTLMDSSGFDYFDAVK